MSFEKLLSVRNIIFGHDRYNKIRPIQIIIVTAMLSNNNNNSIIIIEETTKR